MRRVDSVIKKLSELGVEFDRNVLRTNPAGPQPYKKIPIGGRKPPLFINKALDFLRGKHGSFSHQTQMDPDPDPGHPAKTPHRILKGLARSKKRNASHHPSEASFIDPAINFEIETEIIGIHNQIFFFNIALPVRNKAPSPVRDLTFSNALRIYPGLK